MTSKTILITGATGLVGRHFARRAADAGYQVQAMLRGDSDRSVLEGIPVQFVEGDLAQPESLPAALAEADIVVHAAAHVGDWGPAEKYRAINVVALEHMLHAVQRQGRLERWIQISSLGVYPARHHYGTDETLPPDLSGLDGYTKTKAEAEIVIERHVREHGLPAIVLRPGFIYGPGDRHALPRLIEKIQANKMKFLGRGDRLLNNTSVENLCDAILLAMEKPDVFGETFIIRDERLVTREEFVHTIADYLGKPHPRHVPEWLGRLIVGPIETIARLKAQETPPLLTRAQIKFLTVNLDFSIAKAKKLLGYRPRVDFQDGIIAALDYATGKQPASNAINRTHAAAQRTQSSAV
jgi:nucleoside-diphosphate-sugar epimerase